MEKISLEKLSFLPVLINNRAQPVIVSREEEFQDALKYIRDISASQGYATEFRPEQGENVVAA